MELLSIVENAKAQGQSGCNIFWRGLLPGASNASVFEVETPETTTLPQFLPTLLGNRPVRINSTMIAYTPRTNH